MDENSRNIIAVKIILEKKNWEVFFHNLITKVTNAPQKIHVGHLITFPLPFFPFSRYLQGVYLAL